MFAVLKRLMENGELDSQGSPPKKAIKLEKPELPSEASPSNEEALGTNIDDLIDNPGLIHIPEKIFAYLDTESVVNCRKVSNKWKTFVDDSSYLNRNIWQRFEVKCKKGCLKRWTDRMNQFRRLEQNPDEVASFLLLLNKLKDSHFKKTCENGSLAMDVFKHGTPEMLKILLLPEYKNFVIDMENYINPMTMEFSYGKGKTPLHFACESGNIDMIQWLWENFGDDIINDVPTYGRGITINSLFTPFQYACLKGHSDVVRYILDTAYEYDIPIKFETSLKFETPFHLAALNGHSEVFKILLEHYSSINTRNDFGQTPLHVACVEGHIEIVRLLLQNEFIELYPIDENEETPLCIAQKNGFTEIVELLLNHEAENNF